MMALVFVISGILGALGLLHLYWAIGFWVPIRDESGLARSVIGRPGIRNMPGPVPCAVVGMALLFCAVLPHRPDFPARFVLMPMIAAVFIARGIATYLPVWRTLVPEEPFATMDRRVYGPLCVMLGIGYLILVFGEF